MQYRTNSSTCQCYAFKCYSSFRRGASPCTPFFQAGRFVPLSCTAVTRALRQLLQQAGINSLQYSSHTFWIGAATTAAAAGLPVWLIKNLGRWSSDAYLSYIHQQLPIAIINFGNLQVVVTYGCFLATNMGPRQSNKLKRHSDSLCML